VYAEEGLSNDPPLSEMGKRDIAKLAHCLAPFLKNLESEIYYSPRLRTLESACIINEITCSKALLPREELWSDRHHKEDFPWLCGLIESRNEVPVLIFVTHLEYVEDFPAFYYTSKTGREKAFEEPNKGQALLIDVDDFRSIILPCYSEKIESFLGLSRVSSPKIINASPPKKEIDYGDGSDDLPF
jgi:phosphohistidine phosphatase SixA